MLDLLWHTIYTCIYFIALPFQSNYLIITRGLVRKVDIWISKTIAVNTFKTGCCQHSRIRLEIPMHSLKESINISQRKVGANSLPVYADCL